MSNGLQAERTRLAWSRTVLLFVATAALIIRTADSTFERGVAIALAAGGLLLALASAWRRQRRIAVGGPMSAPASSAVGGLVVGLAALLVAGVVVIL